MSAKRRKILITHALPYANGPLHLGHMLGFIAGDMWTRFLKLSGHDCLYICGSDSHGTPIMIQAEKMGLAPEVMAAQISKTHQADCADFHVQLDHYYTTHSPENQELVDTIFNTHVKAGNIAKHTITQFFDPIKQLFLPDRYIKGECPRCHTKDQYGDYCENCGATYSPTELIEPYSILSGARPIEKSSEHYFFKLQQFEDFLKKWTSENHLQPSAIKKLNEWFEAGLKEWDISRDAPYFGFLIPGEKQKYFYVWLDAPVGYMATFKHLCSQNKSLNFDEYWKADSQAELYHVIGKDIMYFHALFWPALLQGAHYRTPTSIFAHGFLTIDGQKMSKSRGTFIKARTYLNHLNPEYLRYYFAAKLSDNIEDLDIQFEDFMNRINADLVGKFINIASRSAPFITQYSDGLLSAALDDPTLYQSFVDAGERIAAHFNQLQFSHAVREIMRLADRANQYIDEQKPWVLAKDPSQHQRTQAVASQALNLFRALMIYLKPILPQTAQAVETFLNIPPLTFQDRETPLTCHRIQPFKPLLQRIDPKHIEELKMATIQDTAAQPAATPPESGKPTSINIEDFNKIDLRVGKVLEAEAVEGADKLLRLKVDLGNETRQIFSGIKASFSPEELIGKNVVVVANLAPRKMRFGVSEGMVIVAHGEENLALITANDNAHPGAKVS